MRGRRKGLWLACLLALAVLAVGCAKNPKAGIVIARDVAGRGLAEGVCAFTF